MTARHIYVDETKPRGSYIIVASVHIADDVHVARKVVQELLLPGQRYLHMKNESEGRKRQIATAIVDAQIIQGSIYNAGKRYRTDNDRRAKCLEALVAHHADGPETLLVIDRDDSLVNFDNQRLIEYTRKAGCRDTLRYEHRSDKTEPLLGIPDAIAWCWAKGGPWRQLIEPAIVGVYEV
ncbi:hypothetical protein [Mycolicibacterium fortuitum]